MPNVLKKFIRPKAEPYRFPQTSELTEPKPVGEATSSEETSSPEQAVSAPPDGESGESRTADPMDYAAVQAEAILNRARTQAEELKANAMAEARQELEQIREGARQEGFREGHAQGMASAMEENRQYREAQAAQMEQEIKTFLEKAMRVQADLIESAQNSLRDLAIAVAEKVVRVSLKSSSGVIARMIQGATEKLKRREWVHIYIAGCDAKGIASVAPQLTLSLAALSDHIRIVPMSEEESGTCIIETPDTIIDASASTQFSNIRTLLADIPADDGTDADFGHRAGKKERIQRVQTDDPTATECRDVQPDGEN
ncbi:MAG: F0F1 ATP synthase subunit delta [Intestinimonas sp.]|nr:F0F1 ATP synthase subunit delta [Intestinimonas sp.]